MCPVAEVTFGNKYTPFSLSTIVVLLLVLGGLYQVNARSWSVGIAVASLCLSSLTGEASSQ